MRLGYQHALCARHVAAMDCGSQALEFRRDIIDVCVAEHPAPHQDGGALIFRCQYRSGDFLAFGLRCLRGHFLLRDNGFFGHAVGSSGVRS
ncbi:hypothetical protein D3C78_1647520 [compost metagenome]